MGAYGGEGYYDNTGSGRGGVRNTGEAGLLSQTLTDYKNDPNSLNQFNAQRAWAEYTGNSYDDPNNLAQLQKLSGTGAPPPPNGGGGGYGGGGYGGGGYGMASNRDYWKELMAQLDFKREELAQSLQIENSKLQTQRDIENQRIASAEKLKQEELANQKYISGQTNISEYDKMLAGLKGPADPYSYLFMSRGLTAPRGYQAAQMALPQSVLDQMKNQGIDQKQLQDWLTGNGATNAGNASMQGQGQAPTFAGVLGGMPAAFNQGGQSPMFYQAPTMGANAQRMAGPAGQMGVMGAGAPNMNMSDNGTIANNPNVQYGSFNQRGQVGAFDRDENGPSINGQFSDMRQMPKLGRPDGTMLPPPNPSTPQGWTTNGPSGGMPRPPQNAGYGAEPMGMNSMPPPMPIGSQGVLGGWQSSGPIGFQYGGQQSPSMLTGGIPTGGGVRTPMDLNKLDPYTRALVDSNGRPMAPSAQQMNEMPQSGLDAYKDYTNNVAGVNAQDMLDLSKRLAPQGAPAAGGAWK